MPSAESWLSDAPLLLALIGGMLIGLAAAMLWVLDGRIAGVSGIAGRLLRARGDDALWRAAFLIGLGGGGVVLSRVLPGAFERALSSPAMLVVAGLLVGVGTTLANGCTSGHGVCGVSRLSLRSLVAVGSFVAAGMAVVYLARHVIGVLP